MDILIGTVIFVLLTVLVLVVAVCAMMISTAKELTEAIRNINFDKDMKKKNKFIEPKNRKDWGIH